MLEWVENEGMEYWEIMGGMFNEERYEIMYQLSYEAYAAEYTQMIALAPIYMFVDAPHPDTYTDSTEDGLPFFNDMAEAQFAHIPNDFSFEE